MNSRQPRSAGPSNLRFAASPLARTIVALTGANSEKLTRHLYCFTTAAVIGLSVSAGNAHAQAQSVFSWERTGTGSWFDLANWGGALPDANTYVLLNVDGARIQVAAPGARALGFDLNGASATPATLEVLGGGTLDISDPNLRNPFMLVGGNGRTGRVIVSGPGSAFRVGTSILSVSNDSSIQVLSGGVMEVTGLVSGGLVVDSGSSVLVDGQGSSLTVTGLSSTGPITIRNGGRLAALNDFSLRLEPNAPQQVGSLNVGDGGQAGILDTSLVRGEAGTTVNFNHTDNIAVGTSFSRDLALNKRGVGALQMNGVSTYAGPTAVEGGTLRAGAANVFSPNSAHAVSAGATLDLAGFNQTLQSLTNSGTVSTVGSAPGTALTVTGAYVGNGGVLRLGTALGDSASATDRLVLDGAGASASGTTTVQITNLGGLGAPTTGNGIEVIAARNGATTTAQTTQNAFTLANGNGVAVPKGTPVLQATTAVGGHVDVGAFEYRLYAADANGAGESWYLRNNVPAAAAPVGGGATALGFPALPAVTAYRSEVPLYASVAGQLRQGGLAMLSNRHQRIGDDEPTVAGAG
ncbi:MAG: hypothetical protein KJ901_13570, partial [Gammaproteobacteria bacterium]|nr:hypothetical protein [Gammaproteobacteria bacterium]MBU1444423.1 hypothetical protein [Gammaproteobacteria bacterium]